MRTFQKMTLVAVLALAAGMQASAQRLITFKDLIDGERVGSVQLSRSGKYVLEHFSVTDGPETSR